VHIAVARYVRTRGDAALLDYTERFDRVKLTAARLRVANAAETARAHVRGVEVSRAEIEHLRAESHRALRETPVSAPGTASSTIPSPSSITSPGRRAATARAGPR
jgi:histidinol dehydrogenase